MNKLTFNLGLSVSIPEQEIEIIPVALRMPDGIPDSEDFTLIRRIANIGLFTADDLESGNFDNPLQVFDPPIDIEVTYNKADLAPLKKENNKLKLAYWNLNKWVIIFEDEYQNLLRGSTVTVQIDSFLGDPTLGWGR